ncbi:MAG: hypothetical protein ACLFQV_11340, partial [Vulcanimicrobiota bacterium]
MAKDIFKTINSIVLDLKNEISLEETEHLLLAFFLNFNYSRISHMNIQQPQLQLFPPGFSNFPHPSVKLDAPTRKMLTDFCKTGGLEAGALIHEYFLEK